MGKCCTVAKRLENHFTTSTTMGDTAAFCCNLLYLLVGLSFIFYLCDSWHQFFLTCAIFGGSLLLLAGLRWLCRRITGVQCQLCLQKVKVNQWDDGSHRRECAETNAEVIAQFRSPLELECPKCQSGLMLEWPIKQEYFRCDRAWCSEGNRYGQIRDAGVKRYVCFPCDHNLCRKCMEKCIKENGSDV